MVNKNYFDFKKINENVQQAKVYLNRRALDQKRKEFKETNPDATEQEVSQITLSSEEVRESERNKLFQSIKTITANDNYTFLMTKIFFEETEGRDEDLSEIERLYNNIKKNIVTEFITLPSGDKQTKTRIGLPKNIEMYVNPERFLKGKISDEEYKQFTLRGDGVTKKTISEMITDDIIRSEGDRDFVAFVNKLLPAQKAWVDSASKIQREKLKSISKSFTTLGVEDGGKVNEKLQKFLQENFFDKISFYKNLEDLIHHATKTIKAAENVNADKFLNKINKVNENFGERNGAKILYNENRILVIEVLSYAANEILNGHTAHCISRGLGSWNTYVRDFGKQYYIYNYNLEPSNNDSVIGLTIQSKSLFDNTKTDDKKLIEIIPGSIVTFAHSFDDTNILSEITSIIKKWNIPKTLFKAMTEEEMSIRREAKIATSEIQKSGLSFEKIQELLKKGANPNINNSLPIINMIKQDSLETVKYMIEYGGVVRGEFLDPPIDHSKSLEMIKLLVDHGAEITYKVFEKSLSMEDPINVVRYLLDNGFNPMSFRGFPFRKAATIGNVEVLKLLYESADNIPGKKPIKDKRLEMLTERFYSVFTSCIDTFQKESLKFCLDKLFELGDESMQSTPVSKKGLKPYEEMKSELKSEVEANGNLNKEQKDELSDLLDSWFNEKFGEDSVKESNRLHNFRYFQY